VDIVLEAASGKVEEESFKLTSPLVRIVVFGAKNIQDTISSEQFRQIVL
jgi:hypothetical protein